MQYTWEQIPNEVKEFVNDYSEREENTEMANEVMKLIDRAYKEGEEQGFRGGEQYGIDMNYHQWCREIQKTE